MISRAEFDSEIKNILHQLVENYKPEKIILFGSLANGEITDGTDIDFCIVKKDVPNIGVERIRNLEKLINYKIATDFIIYKPEEVEKRLSMGDPFLKNIFEEGILLYEAA